MGIETRQQRRPGRAAAGGIVVLGKAQAIGRQTVQVRRLDFPPERTKIGIAHVVDQNDDDVGLAGKGHSGKKKQKGKQAFGLHTCFSPCFES